jgi:thioredoxin-like negative regulator of GroEL
MLSTENTTPNIEFLYFKNDTCQPCKVLRVKVEELLKQHFPSIEFKVIEIKEHPEFVESLRIFSSPTMVLLIDSMEYYRGGIYTSLSELKDKLTRIFDIAS